MKDDASQALNLSNVYLGFFPVYISNSRRVAHAFSPIPLSGPHCLVLFAEPTQTGH